MTQDTQITVITVNVSHTDGHLFASSKDLFGLNVCARGEEELIERLKIGVKWLFKQNRGEDVEVHVPSSPQDFPRASNRVLGQLVVAQAAAHA